MATSDGMRWLIHDLTQDVIKAYQIPIPIERIEEVVNRIGGVVREDESLSGYSDGYIRKIGSDGFEIVVSPFQPPNRRNFTIAHELGHLFLHMGYQIDEDLWNRQRETYYRNGTSEEEYQSNEFAAALLMPKREYKKVMDQYTNGDTVDIASIAEYFHVSVNAASNRGKWLGYLQW